MHTATFFKASDECMFVGFVCQPKCEIGCWVINHIFLDIESYLEIENISTPLVGNISFKGIFKMAV